MSKELPQYFVRDKRDNGETFYRMVDERPQWLYDAVYECHCSDLPRDWIFETCAAAWDGIREGSLTDQDDVHEWADGMVDVYTKDLAAWYEDMCLTDTYAQAEEDARDAGMGKDDIDRQLTSIQYFAIYRIASTILQAYTDSLESEDSEDSDEDLEAVAADKE